MHLYRPNPPPTAFTFAHIADRPVNALSKEAVADLVKAALLTGMLRRVTLMTPKGELDVYASFFSGGDPTGDGGIESFRQKGGKPTYGQMWLPASSRARAEMAVKWAETDGCKGGVPQKISISSIVARYVTVMLVRLGRLHRVGDRLPDMPIVADS